MSYLKQSYIDIDTPMAPPAWALMEWELIRTQERACAEFFEHYFDERGYLECIPRWGGNDGPDDAIENLVHWPLLYLLGGRDELRAMCMGILDQRSYYGTVAQMSRQQKTDHESYRTCMAICPFNRCHLASSVRN